MGLGELPGVADGFASVPGVGEGRVAAFFSELDAGETPGDGLPSVVGDFFAVAVVCVDRWRTTWVVVAPASRILLPVLSKVLPTVLSVALAPREIALPVA